MAYQLNPFNSAIIGNDEFYVFRMLDVGSKEIKPTYDAPIRIDGLVNMTANASGELASDYADNTVHEVGATQGDFTLESEITGLSEAGFGLVFGRYLPLAGGAAIYASQNPPSLATAWQTMKANGKRVRHIAYNVKYPEAEFGSATKADGIEFQHITLSGQGAGILYSFVGVDRATDETVDISGLKHYMMDEESDAFNQDIWDAWFSAPQYPEGAAADAADLTTLTFAAGANNGDTVATFTYASAESFVYKLAPVSDAKIGDVIAGGISIESGDTIEGVVTGNKVGIFGLDANGKVIAGNVHTLKSDEIK